jgi:hypothetical protein
MLMALGGRTAGTPVSAFAWHSSGRPPNVSHIVVDGDSTEPLSQHVSSPLVGFALEHDAVSGSLESEVDAADP